jgi:hypothetical protein
MAQHAPCASAVRIASTDGGQRFAMCIAYTSVYIIYISDIIIVFRRVCPANESRKDGGSCE